MPRFFTPPNQLTLLRILLTPVFVSLFLSPHASFRIWSFIVLTVAMATDWYDGWVARRWGFVTRWGAFFDPLADKVFISAAYFTFLWVGLVPAWTVWVIAIRDIGITFLRSYSEMSGVAFKTSFPAKVKTFGQFVVLYYILLTYVGRTAFDEVSAVNAWASSIYLQVVVDSSMALIAAITIVTGVQYLFFHFSTIRQKNGSEPASKPD